MIAVTGATGQLGRLVVEELLKSRPPGEVVAAVRDPAKAADLAARGVVVREADYDRPGTLAAMLDGVERLLLISSDKVGGRLAQHRAVVEAAARAGVGLIAYTSILRADATPAKLAREHRETERLIAESGLSSVILRNGWYTENELMGLAPALEHGALVGSAGEGRISVAARADYAAAAARVLTGDGHAGRTYELAGDEGPTRAEIAAEIGRLAGRPVVYRDLPEAEYRAVLVGAGLPEALAEALADEDAHAAGGSLFDDGRALGRLIGRPTTPWRETLAAAVGATARG